MGSVQIYISDKEILREVWDEVMAEGIAKGKAESIAEGMAEGLQTALRIILEGRFGSIPAWAEARLQGADIAQMGIWLKPALTADTIQSALDG